MFEYLFIFISLLSVDLILVSVLQEPYGSLTCVFNGKPKFCTISNEVFLTSNYAFI